MREALPPIVSIINKTTKAQSKYEKGSSQFNRFQHIIQAMLISKTFIECQINSDSELWLVPIYSNKKMRTST